MADTKITQLSTITSFADADLGVFVDDVAGTPVNRSFRFDGLKDYAVTQATVGLALYPRTAAEIAASVTPTDYSYAPGNMLRYGANISPGVTNMTTALLNAIAANDGFSVTIPDEVVLTDSQALDTLTNGITIQGSGPNSTLLMRQVASSSEVLGSNDNAVDNIQIKNLKIDCNYAVHGPAGSAPNTNITGIRLGDSTASGSVSTNVLIDNVRVIDPTQHGAIISRCSNGRILGSYVESWEGFGLIFFRGCEDCVISDNHLNDVRQTATVGIQIDDRSTASTTPEPNKGISVVGNVLDMNNGGGNGIQSTANLGVTILANTIRDASNGIVTNNNETDSTTLRDGNETIISNNIIDGCTSTGNDAGGIFIQGGYNIVTGNIIRDGAGNGLSVAEGHTGLTIEGNVIKGNIFKLNATTSGAEILVQVGNNCSIEGNTIEATSIGIRAAAFDDTIAGIGIKNNRIKAGASFAIEVRNDSGDVSEVSIDDNEIYNVASGQAAIRVNDIGAQALSEIYIRRNRIRDEAAASTGISIVDAGIANTRIEFNVVDCTTPYSNSATNADVVFLWGNSFDPRIVYGSAAPTGGTWSQGDIVYDSTPSAAGTMGWVCTTGGTPGTWKTFGTIAV